MASRKILIIGDLHCGSMAGLTHPDWIVSAGRNRHFSELQEEMWDQYIETLNDFGPVDTLVVNGDAIDGKGPKTGGTELITSDLLEQSDMAVAAIEQVKADKIYFTHGTPYHVTSSGEDFERIIADQFKAPIFDSMNLDVDGVVFNIRHHVSSSTSPYNRANGVSRERLWDFLNAARIGDEAADVYVRSHVHYFSYCGESNWIGVTLPALQAGETKFGSRRCIGMSDWGMTLFHVEDGKYAGYDLRIYPLQSSRKNVVVVR